ncbi:MAG: MarR family transcriptional regulator [Alphaproteobacteria bacterium]|jgi:DNA-binding MarR family transcriptional regulator|nr:MarR family transcriptional regulator [Alphaproteobacteria bacterium]
MISPSDFLEKVEFRDAALLSFVTSAIIVPAYDAVKRDLGITRSEYLLLMALSHYPVLTAQDVSRLSGRPRNSISRAVHRMLAVGHLARDPDPTDARQARLSITETGRALHRQIAERIRVYQEEVLSPLTEQERETVVNLLTKVVAQRPSAGAAEL